MRQTPSRSRADRELDLLCEAFAAGRVTCVPSGLADVHARCVTAPPSPEPVLAISVGGSTTKLMLARLGRRTIDVVDALAIPNPLTPTPWDVFFRDLLYRSPAAIDFLRAAAEPRVGVSLAVPIQDGVPHHPSKMPTIAGLVSRAPTDDIATHHFGRNLAQLLKSFGAMEPRVAYQSDGVLAHLGAFFLSDLSPTDRTMLLVCGTGLACATRDEFILCGMACILPDDNPVTAHHATEGGQYQHLIAGKGLWGIMRRSLLQAAARHQREDLALFGESFASPVDSVRVRDLAVGDSTTPALDAFAEEIARSVARDVLDAGAIALANCTLASAAHAFPGQSGIVVQLLLEGSIAMDPVILENINRRFESVGARFPRLHVASVRTPRAPADVTVAGAAVLGTHQ